MCVLCCRYEILLIAYRKPEWDWPSDMERASCQVNSSTGALTALPGYPPPPAGILFPSQWVDQAFVSGGGAGGGMRGEDDRGGGNRGRHGHGGGRLGSHPSSSSAAPPPPRASIATGPASLLTTAASTGSAANNDYYSGDMCGFIVGCTSNMLEECFARCSICSYFI